MRKILILLFLLFANLQSLFAYLTLEGGFEEALKTGDISIFKKEIKIHQGQERLKKVLNKYSDDDHTPLYYAVSKGDYGLVVDMLENGADVNAPQGSERFPILMSALRTEKPDIKIIKALLEKNANCNWVQSSVERKFKNCTAMLLACWSNDAGIIELILRHTYKYDVRMSFENETGTYSYTPIEWLLFLYKPEYYSIIEDLITNKKVDINSFPQFADSVLTPVVFPSVHENKKLQKLILDNLDYDKIQDEKIQFTDTVSCEGTVLNFLCRWYDPENFDCMKVIEKLLEKNIDVNEVFKAGDDYEYSPLLAFAVKDNPDQYAEIIKKLLEKGADPNKICRYGENYDVSAMHLAAIFGSDVLLKLFKEYGGDLKLKDSDDKTPLDYYVAYRKEHKTNDAETLVDLYFYEDKKVDWEQVKALNPNAKTQDNRNILHIAILNDDEENATKIINAYPNLWKETDSQGKSSLDYAFKNRFTDVLNTIIDGKRILGSALFSVIDNALETGDTGYLEESLSNKADDFSKLRQQLKFGNRKLNVDPVVYASIFDYADTPESEENINRKKLNKSKIIDFLVNNQVRFSKEGLNDKFAGNSPIVLCDDDEAIKLLLLKYGANPALKGNEGYNAIDYAFRKNQTSVIDWLLKNKIKLGNSIFSAIDGELENNVRLLEFLALDEKKSFLKERKSENIDGQEVQCGVFVYTMLSDGIDKKANAAIRKEILSLLLEKGADVNETVSGGIYGGCSALSIAALKGESEIIDFLLSHGADLNKRDSARKTALFYALESKNTKTVDILLKAYNYTFDDILSANNESLLMYFARYGTFEQLNSFLPALVSKNENVLERRDKRGLTPFLYAAAYNHDYRIMKLLRMYGANVFAKDNDGNNALDLAKKYENTTDEDSSIGDRLKSYGVY